MLQAIYCSVATRGFAEDELVDILEQARVKNFRQEITGMLLYEQGAFIQVIEGPKENIERLLTTLLADPRHHKVQILSLKSVTAREFGQWDMAFFRRSATQSDPDGYLDLASISEEFTVDSSVATQMLSLFQAGLFKDAAEGHADSAGSCTVTLRSGRPGSDPKRQRYLVELGRAMALSLPDVPVAVAAEGATVSFNQRRDLDCGEIEMF
jgi:hypothetical protein